MVSFKELFKETTTFSVMDEYEVSKELFNNVLNDILCMSKIIQPTLSPMLARECWGIRA